MSSPAQNIGNMSNKKYRPKFQKIEDFLDGSTRRSLDRDYNPSDITSIMNNSKRDIFG